MEFTFTATIPTPTPTATTDKPPDRGRKENEKSMSFRGKVLEKPTVERKEKKRPIGYIW